LLNSFLAAGGFVIIFGNTALAALNNIDATSMNDMPPECPRLSIYGAIAGVKV
jgi:hypothetical protein